jgi:SAM-dependent methyltransferase
MSVDGGVLVCDGPQRHVAETEEGVLVFARPDAGKYEPEYAARYAALWAFGYQTLHSGLDEGLYRTVSSFVAEALAEAENPVPVIIDAGCGVGRVLGDVAALARRGVVIAFDASPAMLDFARHVVVEGQAMDVSLPRYGFPSLRIEGVGTSNVVLGRANVEELPLTDGCADIVLSVNIVDRLPHGPELAFRECHRVLRPGGTFIFTDPFNWIDPQLWTKYPDAASVLGLLEQSGFRVETWFDDLLYREIADGRASFNEFRTLAVKACKT